MGHPSNLARCVAISNPLDIVTGRLVRQHTGGEVRMTQQLSETTAPPSLGRHAAAVPTVTSTGVHRVPGRHDRERRVRDDQRNLHAGVSRRPRDPFRGRPHAWHPHQRRRRLAARQRRRLDHLRRRGRPPHRPNKIGIRTVGISDVARAHTARRRRYRHGGPPPHAQLEPTPHWQPVDRPSG